MAATVLPAPTKIRVAVPSEGPLLTAILMCPTCGQIVLPTFTRMANGRISSITFYHMNAEYGCAWKSVSQMHRTSGETSGLVSQVRAGADTNGHPKYADEHDFATGKSFDVEAMAQQQGDKPVIDWDKVREFVNRILSESAKPQMVPMSTEAPARPKFQPPLVKKPAPVAKPAEPTASGEPQTSAE